jgi:hypothetical protein
MKFTREQLHEQIRNQLTSDEMSGVPFEGRVAMLTYWVEGIIKLEVEHALHNLSRYRVMGELIRITRNQVEQVSTVQKDIKKCDRCGADELQTWAVPIEKVTLHRASVNGGRVMDLCKLCLEEVTQYMECRGPRI